MIRKILGSGPISLDAGLLAIRLLAGIVLAIAGWGKMTNIGPFVETVTKMELPLPALLAWAAAISEFFGGIFLAAGLLTRFATAAIAATMGVAVFKALANDAFVTTMHKQFAATLLTTAIGIFLTGPGRFSFDAWLAGAGSGGSKAK